MICICVWVEGQFTITTEVEREKIERGHKERKREKTRENERGEREREREGERQIHNTRERTAELHHPVRKNPPRGGARCYTPSTTTWRSAGASQSAPATSTFGGVCSKRERRRRIDLVNNTFSQNTPAPRSWSSYTKHDGENNIHQIKVSLTFIKCI